MTDIKTELRDLVHHHGLARVVGTLAQICADWTVNLSQDEESDKAWLEDFKTMNHAYHAVLSNSHVKEPCDEGIDDDE